MAQSERVMGGRVVGEAPSKTVRRWAADHSAVTRRRAILTTAVEANVIPRLLLAHRAAAAAPPVFQITGEVAEVAGLLLANKLAQAEDAIAKLRRAGLSVDALYLDLLAPIARHLGTMWDEDLCDFGQVTIGLAQLRRWLLHYSDQFMAQGACADPNRRILLVPAPGENHTFGLTMVTEFFRAGGWTAWSGAPPDMAALLDIVSREWFAVIGFSVATGLHLDALASGIREVRQASNNRSIGVMVGGPLFVAHPEMAKQVGADATASDGRGAVEKAQALLTASFHERPVKGERASRAG